MFCEGVNGTVSGTVSGTTVRPWKERKEEADGGGRVRRERGEVDRRDVISRVMNEVTDETSEKASGGGGRFTTFRSVDYIALLLPSLASRGPKRSRVASPTSASRNTSHHD